jgi:hypothetical protein
MNFERGLEPKEAMSIGGINLQEVCNNTIFKGMTDLTKFMNQFIGKKITFSLDRNAYHTTQQIEGYPETRTITVREWDYENLGMTYISIYFMQSEFDKSFDPLCCTAQKWFVDISKRIYVH